MALEVVCSRPGLLSFTITKMALVALIAVGMLALPVPIEIVRCAESFTAAITPGKAAAEWFCMPCNVLP